MRYLEYWITDHTDNSGFTVETKPNPKAFGACNYHHVIDFEAYSRAVELIGKLEKEFKYVERAKDEDGFLEVHYTELDKALNLIKEWRSK